MAFHSFVFGVYTLSFDKQPVRLSSVQIVRRSRGMQRKKVFQHKMARLVLDRLQLLHSKSNIQTVHSKYNIQTVDK